MEGREGLNRRSVEPGETENGEKLARAETVERYERQTAECGENVKLQLPKACVSETGINSEMALMEA